VGRTPAAPADCRPRRPILGGGRPVPGGGRQSLGGGRRDLVGAGRDLVGGFRGRGEAGRRAMGGRPYGTRPGDGRPMKTRRADRGQTGRVGSELRQWRPIESWGSGADFSGADPGLNQGDRWWEAAVEYRAGETGENGDRDQDGNRQATELRRAGGGGHGNPN
jgi:hypothetical protein